MQGLTKKVEPIVILTFHGLTKPNSDKVFDERLRKERKLKANLVTTTGIIEELSSVDELAVPGSLIVSGAPFLSMSSFSFL